MNKSELIDLLLSNDEDDVLIEVDGILYDFEIDHEEEQFDGFDTVYPACLIFKPKLKDE
jgi:hypothetical protein